MVQLSQPYMTTGKTIALTMPTFVGRVMSLLFNTLSRFVIAFLPRSNHLLISWLSSPSALILEPKKRKSVTASTFSPSVCHEVIGPDIMILVFKSWTLSWLFILLLHPHQEALSSSSLSAIKVVSSIYLRLLFLLAVLIPACNSSSPAFHMMCSAYKLNKQDDNKQPCYTPFSILKQSVVPYRIQKCKQHDVLCHQFSSVAQSCPTLCDPMNCSTPGLSVHHQLLEFTQIHVHRVSDAIQPSHPL